MKNVYFLLLSVTSITTLSAQIQKGTILLGGSLGFNNTNQDGENLTTINISPSAGFFLSNRFAVGSSLNLSLTANDGFSASTIGLGPFARYYFNNSGPARFFGQANVGFQAVFLGDNDGIGLLTSGLGIGADFFLNDHVSIVGLLGYQRVQSSRSEFNYGNIGLNFGIAAFIGGGRE